MGRRGAGGCGDSVGMRVAPPALPVSPRGHASEATRAGGAHPQRTAACHRVPNACREGTARPLGDTATTDGEGCADPRSAALPTTQPTAPRLRHPRGHPGTPGGSQRTDRPGAQPDTPSTAPRHRVRVPVLPQRAGDVGIPRNPRPCRCPGMGRSRSSRHPGRRTRPWDGDTAMVGGGHGCYEHSSTCATGSALQVAHSSASPPQKGPVCTQKSPPGCRAW